MTLHVLDYDSPADRRTLLSLIDRLREQSGGGGAGAEAAETAATVIDAVRREGDDAVVRFMRRWTDPNFTAQRIRVSEEELRDAERALDPPLHEAMRRAIDHVRTYQEHITPPHPPPVEIAGARLGLRFTPMAGVGLHVPGGRAAYPSSVIMLGVPAQVAGVERMCIVSPPPTSSGASSHPPGDISPLVLGACRMLGIERVYRIGGAQAIAALALGTEHVEPVDFIAGPGNAYVQQAKKQLLGRVGIDGMLGPSEIVVLADGSCEPRWVAADLLAQAEHDPGCCFLIGADRGVIERIVDQVHRQLPRRRRRDAIEKALSDWSAAIHVPDEPTACELIDTLAAEHVTLAVEDPHRMLKRLRHGGAWFLGDSAPVASGDYYAGPSHCLPTGTTARYGSGLSVYTFLKRSSVEQYPGGVDAQAAQDIASLAEAEGLEGHAHSVRVRRGDQED